MISLDDILDLSSLSRDEIAALAEHGHMGRVNAALMGEWLMRHHGGAHKIEQAICDDIRAALHKGDLTHARDLYATLHAFVQAHPEAVRGA